MEVSAGRPQERRRLQRVACAVGLLVIGIMGRSVPIASFFSSVSVPPKPFAHRRTFTRLCETSTDWRTHCTESGSEDTRTTATYPHAFRGRSIRVQEPPNEGLPGLRSMMVVDPDGNKLHICTRLPD